jgi:hypothetical protein
MTAAEVGAMKLHITRGRPLGDEAWIVRTAKALGLEQTLRPRGRPPGWRKPESERKTV